MHQPETPEFNPTPPSQGRMEVAGKALDKMLNTASAFVRQKGVLRISQAGLFALIWLSIALFALSSCSKAEPVVTPVNDVPQVTPVAFSQPIVQFEVPPGTCPANNGFMTLSGANPVGPDPVLLVYPAFSADNPSPVEITVSSTSTTTTEEEVPAPDAPLAIASPILEKDFGEVGYVPGTPWDPTNTSAFQFIDDSGDGFTATITVSFAVPVYGLKFLVSDLNRVSESVEIRVYDESGALIPTSVITQRTQLTLNEPINSHSFMTEFVNPLGVGIGGGYLYSATMDSTGGTTTTIYVQMSSLQAASRYEIEFASRDVGELIISAPYFNLACLRKEFIPPAIYLTETAVMSIEVINSYSEPMRSDINFTDILTPGLLLAGVPAPTQCGAEVSATMSNTLVVTGVSFALGEVYCDITVEVSGTLPVTYLNAAGNFTAFTSLDPSGANAALQVLPPEILGDPISGTYGMSYTFQFGTIGFPNTPVFSATGNLPPGIVMLPTGELSGTALAAGIFGPIDVVAGDGVVTATRIVTVEIVPAPLIIRADDKVKIWGHPLPTFTATFFGLLLDDTPADFTLMFTTTATMNSPVGYYPIFVTSNDDPNYIEIYEQGILTIRYETTTPGLRDMDKPKKHHHHKPVCPPVHHKVYHAKPSHMKPSFHAPHGKPSYGRAPSDRHQARLWMYYKNGVIPPWVQNSGQ